jgi:hypothetical protein
MIRFRNVRYRREKAVILETGNSRTAADRFVESQELRRKGGAPRIFDPDEPLGPYHDRARDRWFAIFRDTGKRLRKYGKTKNEVRDLINLHVFGSPLATIDFPPKDKISRVYFAQSADDGPIKIGHSTNIHIRLMNLRTASPTPIRLVGLMLGGKAEEVSTQMRFAQLNSHGEWFRPGPRLVKFIQGLTPARALFKPARAGATRKGGE